MGQGYSLKFQEKSRRFSSISHEAASKVIMYRGSFRRYKPKKPIVSQPFTLTPFVQDYEMDINVATEEQLMTLPGITRKLAREIIKYRVINGLFMTIDDLLLVPGDIYLLILKF